MTLKFCEIFCLSWIIVQLQIANRKLTLVKLNAVKLTLLSLQSAGLICQSLTLCSQTNFVCTNFALTLHRSQTDTALSLSLTSHSVSRSALLLGRCTKCRALTLGNKWSYNTRIRRTMCALTLGNKLVIHVTHGWQELYNTRMTAAPVTTEQTDWEHGKERAAEVFWFLFLIV